MFVFILSWYYDSDQDYANLAISLATDSKRYSKIRKQLIDHNLNHEESPYWNVERYVKHLEVGYQAIFERYIAGESPAHINITNIMMTNKNISKGSANDRKVKQKVYT